MKKLALVLCFLALLPFSCREKKVYAGEVTAVFDAESSYPVSVDTATAYFNKAYGETIQHYDHDVQSDAICEVESKVGIGASTPVDSTVLTGTGVGTSAWAEIEPVMLDNVSNPGAGEDEFCLTYEHNTTNFEWAVCGAGGGGDNTYSNDTATTDFNIKSSADILITLNAVPAIDEVTATYQTGSIESLEIFDGTIVNVDMGNDGISADKIVLDVTDDTYLDVAAGGTGTNTHTLDRAILGNTAGDLKTSSTGSDYIDMATDNVFSFTRGDAGSVTITCADNSSPVTGCVYDATGAAPITIGSGDVTAITLSTDNTGDGSDVVLPAGSINNTEILSGTIANDRLADATLIDIADGNGSGEAFTFSNGFTIVGDANFNNGATSAGWIDLFEDSSDGSNYVRIQPTAIASDYTLTLPTTDGAAGELLTSDGSGNLTWSAPGAAAAAGSTTEFQYRNAGNLGASANFILDAAAFGLTLQPKVIDDRYMLFGTDDDYGIGYQNTNILTRFITNDNASADANYGMFSFAVDADNSGAEVDDQEVFEIGKNGVDNSGGTWSELFAVDEDGDVTVAGIGTIGSYLNVDGAYIELGTANNPYFTFNETDGTDWQVRVDDTGNSMEIASDAGGCCGTNVELEIYESGEVIAHDRLTAGLAGYDGSIKIYSEEGVTDQYVLFQPAADMTQDTTYTLPPNDGGASEVLSTDGAGVLSWVAAGSGDVTSVGDCVSGACLTGAAAANGTYIRLYDAAGFYIDITGVGGGTLSGNRTITFPNSDEEVGTATDIALDTAGDFGDQDVTSIDKLEGVDANMYIDMGASADGLLLVDDTEIDLTATTIDVNGAMDISGALTSVTSITMGASTAPNIILDDSDGADGQISLDANDADDSRMTLKVDDSKGDDKSYIVLDGVAEQVVVGKLSPNDDNVSFAIQGDADSDAGGDTTETLTIALTPAATPTNSTWDFTDTQGLGFTFDNEVAFKNNAAAATFGAVGTDADVVVAFDAVTSQGSITYKEDEDRFDFDNDVDVVGDLSAATLAVDAANNPYLELNETDGTDWFIKVDDTANTLEYGHTSSVSETPLLSITDTTGNMTILGDLAITGGNITSALTCDSTVTVTGALTATNYAGSANIATVGTITSGTWTGTDIAVADGGTGRSTGTTAYSLIATGTTATGAQQTLANGATTEILVGGGASALPVWTTAQGSGAPVRATSPTLTTPVLGVASGTSLALGADPADAGTIMMPNAGTLTFEASPAGTDVQVLTVTSAEAITIGDANTTAMTFTTDGTGNAEFALPADVIGDADIDWGTGAGQVSGADITFAEGDMTDSTIISADIKDGTIAAADIGTIVESIEWVGGGLVADGTQCKDPAKVTINSGPVAYSIICTDNDAASIYGHAVMPDSWDGGTVTFTLEYLQTAADTNVLNGDIACQCHSATETIDSTYGTEVATDDAAVSGSNKIDHIDSAAVTCAGTCAAGDTLFWRWQLDATGTTTAVATLHFIGVVLEYTSNVGD